MTALVLINDLDRRLIDDIGTVGLVACDIETSGLDAKTNRIGTVQISAPSIGSAVVRISASTPPRRLCQLIEDPKVKKVFHHAMFDLRFMVEHWKVTPANITCTKIASKLLNPGGEQKSHSLQVLLSDRLGIKLSKEQQLSDWLNRDLTSAQIAYAVADVEYLIPLVELLESDLKAAGLYELFRRCLSFIPTRVQLDLGGWPDIFGY